ncbi:hypothetical protein A9Q81_18575 [Gammaproteobacteria bacterium 42_54_T18]|nr:hypothetical protein A9Q81_18575 [Gammaproteobacteria bacterium 42_54_T18]
MSEPIPSATVVLLREANETIEVLLLKRNSKIAYGGMWVFPGGKIDATDYEQSDATVTDGCDRDYGCMLAAAQNAAQRETQEEAGLDIQREKLIYFAHWTTPKVRPKRFSTWFFIARAETYDVTIDGGEIHEHCWRSPADALRAHREGEIELVPPTFLTLLEISPYNSIGEVEGAFSNAQPRIFEPKVEVLPEGLCYFYEGDAGYENSDHQAEGARHRLYAKTNKEWQYQRS